MVVNNVILNKKNMCVITDVIVIFYIGKTSIVRHITGYNDVSLKYK